MDAYVRENEALLQGYFRKRELAPPKR
jgi:hypothetical protein